MGHVQAIDRFGGMVIALDAAERRLLAAIVGGYRVTEAGDQARLDTLYRLLRMDDSPIRSKSRNLADEVHEGRYDQPHP